MALVQFCPTAWTLERTNLYSLFISHPSPCSEKVFPIREGGIGSYLWSKEISPISTGNRGTRYHPSSIGLAERAIQTFKSFMKKSTSGSIEARVSRFLMQYQITPQTTTGISPAEMMMGRRPRSRLDLLIPNLATKMQRKQQSQKTLP